VDSNFRFRVLIGARLPTPSGSVIDYLQSFAPGSPLEGSGFEPSVPLPRLSSIRAVRAEIIGRGTDVFRRDREFDVPAAALNIARLSFVNTSSHEAI
jgi:hypothetical protein